LLPEELVVKQEYRLNLKEPDFLPKELAKRAPKLLGETALGLCDIAVIEHRVGNTIRTTSFKLENEGKR
jgi:hypothetical protein